MKAPTTKSIFLAFLKMGSFAFGGVYSMLAFFERELVDKRKWLSHDEFAEGVVIGQMTPGPPIVNTGIFIGYRLNRLKGALATVAGQVLPSFVLILVIAYFYIEYQHIKAVQAALKGVGAAVVGLIASVVLKMCKSVFKSAGAVVFALSAFLALAVFRLNPIMLILASGAAGLIVYRRRGV